MSKDNYPLNTEPMQFRQDKAQAGPVGGAGELTARILALKDNINFKFGRGIQLADGITLGDLFDAFVKLAAKAPQGVPADSALCPECRSTDNHPYVTYDGVAMRACGRCMIEWRDDTAPRLPGPVSDDTIHHGMVPPALAFTQKIRANREAAAPKPAPPAVGAHPTHPTPGYDAAFYEWFKRSPYYDGYWTQESMDYAEGAYIAAGHASAERVRELADRLAGCLVEARNIVRGRHSTLTYGPASLLMRINRALEAYAALPPSTGEKHDG